VRIDKNSDILIIGQHLTSRTEAVRDFCLSRAARVTVIALGAPLLSNKENHIFEYESGILRNRRVLRHSFLKKITAYKILIPFTFILYLFDIFRTLVTRRTRYDIYIGISHFSGLIGIWLKRLTICRRTIYYAIDCYTPSENADRFRLLALQFSNRIDAWSVSGSDEIWDISPRISEGRSRYEGRLKLTKERYAHKQKIAPLGYSRGFFRNKDVRDIDRYSVVFVGLIVEGQGLELLLEALPEIRKFVPDIKIKVIGAGPFLLKFKDDVKKAGLERFFTFYGFVDTEAMLDIVSSSAAGVSVWARGQNSEYGDPGKTKLYSVCGLPVIVSNDTVYSEVIERKKAGLRIPYDRHALVEAAKTLFSCSDRDYRVYKDNAVEVAREYCDSEKIFSGLLN
jgi:glycosyltransferase involved in cell wall biosynthesis